MHKSFNFYLSLTYFPMVIQSWHHIKESIGPDIHLRALQFRLLNLVVFLKSILKSVSQMIQEFTSVFFQVIIKFFLQHLLKKKHVGITVVSTDASLKEPFTVRFLNQCKFQKLLKIPHSSKDLKESSRNQRGSLLPGGMALIALDSGSQGCTGRETTGSSTQL